MAAKMAPQTHDDAAPIRVAVSQSRPRDHHRRRRARLLALLLLLSALSWLASLLAARFGFDVCVIISCCLSLHRRHRRGRRLRRLRRRLFARSVRAT